MKPTPRAQRTRGALSLLLLLATPVSAQAQQPPAPRSISLAEALKLAASTSEQVAIAKAGEQRARGQLGQARAARLPQINTVLNWQKTLENQFAAISKRASSGSTDNGSGSDTSSSSGGGQAASITRIFASEYTLTFGLSASQPIYTGGRVKANVRAARLSQESAEIGITSAQAQVQLDVTQAYYDAVLADRLVTIAESSLVQSERTLRQVQLTRSVGSASEFELIRARVTRDNQRPGWLQSKTQRELAFERLRNLLDLPASTPILLTDSIAEAPVAPTAPAGAITTVNVDAASVLTVDPSVAANVARVVSATDTAGRSRASVRQAEKAVSVAEQQLKATKASRLPQLSATTNYQRLSYPVNPLPKSLGDFFPNWTVGLGLSYPLFTGGNVRGQITAAEAGVVDARQRLKLAQEGASLDARQATLQLTEAEATWLASVGTAEQAQRAYDIAEVRFREGISTQLELSETRVQLQQALANRARAARDLQVARKRMELLPYLPLNGASSAAATTTTGTAR
jgi:outer membrane protein TolC